MVCKNIEMSWNEINDISQSKMRLIGWDSSLPSIGDTKDFVLGEGTGAINVTVQLVGINHDVLTSGEKARFSFLCKNVYIKKQMGLIESNVGIWKYSELRKWLNDNMYNALPSDLRGNIKKVVKSTDFGASKYVDTTEDNLWIPSCDEISDSTTHPSKKINTAYKAFQKGMGQNKMKMFRYAKSSWWLRSINAHTHSDYLYVCVDGHVSSNSAIKKHGVVFGFCI